MAATSSGGANADCTELYRDAKKLLAQAQKSAARCESALLDLCATRARQEALLAGPTNVGRLRALHDAAPLLEDARAALTKTRELEDRFTELARDERSCRKTIFFRAKTMLASLERTKLTIIFLLQK